MTEVMTASQYREMMADAAPAAGKKRAHKYGAVSKVVDGHTFPSLLEARRYQNLRLLERAGLVRDLKLQRRFPLVVDGERVGVYVCDFLFEERARLDAPWRWVVEDAKGFVTDLYVLKRNLFLRLYPQYEFREVSAPKRAPRQLRGIAHGRHRL